MAVLYLQPADPAPEGTQLLVLRSTSATALHIGLKGGDYIRARTGDTRVALTPSQVYAYQRRLELEPVAQWFATGLLTDVTAEPEPPAAPAPEPETPPAA